MNTISAQKKNGPVALIVLDGWGHREDPTHNAIAQAKTPFFDHLWKTYPHSLLEASGLAVGLPEGQMGNSEIGHTTIGAGKIIDTDLVRIKKAIDSGEFENNPALRRLLAHAKKYDSRIHTLGLISDGGVHSHREHLYAFLRTAKEAGLKKDQVVLHVFTDGRDTLPKTASGYLRHLETTMKEIGMGVFGSFGGRYFGMDRAENWDRIAMVENILFECKGNVCDIREGTISDFMEKQYEKDPSGKIDEYLEHFLVRHENDAHFPISQNDAVFFFNFRADRARQLTNKILERKDSMNLFYATMTQYGDDIETEILFTPDAIETCLAKALSEAGLTQAHVSESEKFPHVTFFLNGQSDVVYPGEKQIKIDSRTDIDTHDKAPDMKAREIVDAAIQALDSGVDVIMVNFPNADVVGHTGNIPAIIEAVEAVDRENERLVKHILKRGGIALVTADHGNAEVNIDFASGEKHTAHTTNPVPIVITDTTRPLSNGGLSDIAPTVLRLLNVPQPASMTGKSLI